MERQREDKWESSYRREADAIHVPAELMEKTRQAMERAMAEEAGVPQPENMRKTGGKRTSRKKTAGILAAAACLCLVFLGSYLIYGSRQDGDLHVIQMTASQDNWDLGVNLGVAGTAGEEAGIWFRSVPSEAFLPEELWQGEASRVDGREVHIGYDKEQELWCAAWEDDGTYYYAEAGEMEEKDFLKELKKIWNSL